MDEDCIPETPPSSPPCKAARLRPVWEEVQATTAGLYQPLAIFVLEIHEGKVGAACETTFSRKTSRKCRATVGTYARVRHARTHTHTHTTLPHRTASIYLGWTQPGGLCSSGLRTHLHGSFLLPYILMAPHGQQAHSMS